MSKAPVMGNVHILLTVLVVTATMPHRLTAGKNQKNTELRVYQGADDVTMKNPYVVTLQPYRFCSGSLITPEWVLTAAHCRDHEPSYIQYGKLSIPLKVTYSRSEVVRSVSHPRYRPYMFSPTDIALILVSPGVHMDKYGTLSALDYSTLLGLSAEYVGGGLTHIPKRNTRNKIFKYMQDLLRPLQIGQGAVISCKPSFRGFICVAPRCKIKQMIMPGDSGGPLLVDNSIVGVAVGGPDDSFYGNSDRFFTPISPHQEWIRSVITLKTK